MRLRRIAFLFALLLFPSHPWAQGEPPGAAHSSEIHGVGTVLGRPVVDSRGETAGMLVDILVDSAGVPVAGVVDVGGFLGVGVRRIAIGWPLLHFVPGTDGVRVTMGLTVASAAAAPEYHGNDGGLIIIDHGP